MRIPDDETLAQKCIDIWGFEAQLNVVVEELAELIQAIQKIRRNKDDQSIINIADEISDVEIVLIQLNCLMNIIDKPLFQKYLTGRRLYKRDRLWTRLQVAEEKLVRK